MDKSFTKKSITCFQLFLFFSPPQQRLFVQVKMSQVKQVGLLAAGCQPWNKDVCAASGDRFAYCATLAIYVYQVRADSLNMNCCKL